MQAYSNSIVHSSSSAHQSAPLFIVVRLISWAGECRQRYRAMHLLAPEYRTTVGLEPETLNAFHPCTIPQLSRGDRDSLAGKYC
ncbi:hypothetical protein DPMN_009184 [Dreissena polymorpha]|uniref:Uncharacterized protein n=1 Tax=Dreissena polymorpha TaxID=45954 RepID=A0A9D4N1V4_DREPO|nr:hypothetical protein DPMN_009184 [Dreissena polymorpha]